MTSGVFFTVNISQQQYFNKAAGAQAMFLAGLKQVEKAIQRDISETFKAEGKLSGHTQWPPLSKLYSMRKHGLSTGKKNYGKAIKGKKTRKLKILQLTGTLHARATSGKLEIIDFKTLKTGYKISTHPGFGSAQRIGIYSKAHMTGSSAGMPARPYVRISGHTIGVMGKVWAGHVLDKLKRSIFIDMAKHTAIPGGIRGGNY